jgi:hypothetical protein
LATNSVFSSSRESMIVSVLSVLICNAIYRALMTSPIVWVIHHLTKS